MKKKRRGRPEKKPSERANEWVRVRVRAEVLRELTAAAKRDQIDFPEWVRTRLLEAARR